ncbi:MAG: hypothetical protein AAFQ67_07280, partial [Pseudomonadota bacterium]
MNVDLPDQKSHFTERNYAVLREAISAESRDMLRTYIDLLERYHGDAMMQEPALKAVGRYVDPMAEAVLEAVRPKVEAATGLNLRPTYSFLRVYKNGAELKRHTDRPSCEISATLHIGGETDEDWPIHVEIDGEARAVPLRPGDMMVYRGIDVPHWRTVFSGQRSAHLFLHYVDANGPHAALAYDQREGLGAPPRVSAPVRLPQGEGHAQRSQNTAPKGQIDMDDLLGDASYCLTTFDFDKGYALFRRVDAELPPRGCRFAEQRPGTAVSIKNLLDAQFDQRLAAAKPMNLVWSTDTGVAHALGRGLNAAPGLFLYAENAVFSQLAQLRRAIDAGQSKCPTDIWRRLLNTALVFHSRTFVLDDVAFALEPPVSNVILRHVLQADERNRGVFLHAPLETYLTDALATDARRAQARAR